MHPSVSWYLHTPVAVWWRHVMEHSHWDNNQFSSQPNKIYITFIINSQYRWVKATLSVMISWFSLNSTILIPYQSDHRWISFCVFLWSPVNFLLNFLNKLASQWVKWIKSLKVFINLNCPHHNQLLIFSIIFTYICFERIFFIHSNVKSSLL